MAQTDDGVWPSLPNARVGGVVLLGRSGLHLGGEGHGALLLDHAGHGAAVTHHRGLHTLADSEVGIVLVIWRKQKLKEGFKQQSSRKNKIVTDGHQQPPERVEKQLANITSLNYNCDKVESKEQGGGRERGGREREGEGERG